MHIKNICRYENSTDSLLAEIRTATISDTPKCTDQESLSASRWKLFVEATKTNNCQKRDCLASSTPTNENGDRIAKRHLMARRQQTMKSTAQSWRCISNATRLCRKRMGICLLQVKWKLLSNGDAATKPNSDGVNRHRAVSQGILLAFSSSSQTFHAASMFDHRAATSDFRASPSLDPGFYPAQVSMPGKLLSRSGARRFNSETASAPTNSRV